MAVYLNVDYLFCSNQMRTSLVYHRNLSPRDRWPEIAEPLRTRTFKVKSQNWRFGHLAKGCETWGFGLGFKMLVKKMEKQTNIFPENLNHEWFGFIMDFLDSTPEFSRREQPITSPLLNVAISTACREYDLQSSKRIQLRLYRMGPPR